ncbi:Alpha-keto acid decarboxylase family protein [Sulfidibacter corallicola]|uniref:Alpha-keto acid decarboxylase family protein n=1 Tax=Sulfidibacter corallicola TaxID=2818388 RepID=A0A8A4TQX3_SULCO|nr:thiamine pyrophosphate-binding protein [Sulfidibacter corallicola]QTD48925.1 alpha-keto acid decarboxylase family protein [Sulfidibacter corallicola]
MSSETLAGYLFNRLKQHGVIHTFGIPGDFALPLYRAQQDAGVDTVVCSHEPNALFAADAYARLRGLGVAVATYGPGALNMVNPMAMAYAEHSPVLLISAAPGVGQRHMAQIHHLVKTHESQLKILREVTAAAAVLDNPSTARDDIDRVLGTILSEHRSGYLEIPSDMTFAPLPERPATPSPVVQAVTGPSAAGLNEAAREIVDLVRAARSAVVMVGVGLRRSQVAREVIRLVEAWQVPVVSSVMGKSVFPERHPLFRGVFMGDLGDPEARRIVADADCVVKIGVIDSDVNNGFGTAEIPPECCISLCKHGVWVRHHHYPEHYIADVMGALVSECAERDVAPIAPAIQAKPVRPAGDVATLASLGEELQALLDGGTQVLADVGESWFLGLELKVDTFMAPGFYASMGFAVPGALGAGLADPDKRPVVLTGDGSFQMTGNDLAVMKARGLRPVIIVLNNSYYELLEVIDGPRDYFALPSWDYVGIAEAQGCAGQRVERVGELREALARAWDASEPFLIEVVISRQDHAPMMERIRQFFEEKAKSQG